jgi:putative IMPACT (imprinted ancient) family translation regulator
LTDVCVVVTRYFGGTKLGVGGLIRAYGDAAEHVFASTEQVTKYLLDAFSVSFPHAHISTIMHVASLCGARIVETAYDEEVHCVLEIRKSKAGELRSSLVNHTGGNVRIKSRT